MFGQKQKLCRQLQKKLETRAGSMREEIPQKAPNGQPYTKEPPYILYFLKQKDFAVVHFLAVFSHLHNLFSILSFQICIHQRIS